MTVLIDTGVLLLAHDRNDPSHSTILNAFRRLQRDRLTLLTTTQNLREFWNVSTRPSTARGGYGVPIEEVVHRLRQIEGFIQVVPESPGSFARWKLLVKANNVVGTKVHDANLAAIVVENKIDYLLTMNTDDFRRFSLAGVMTPAECVAMPSL